MSIWKGLTHFKYLSVNWSHLIGTNFGKNVKHKMVPSALITMKKDKRYPREGLPSYKNYKTISANSLTVFLMRWFHQQNQEFGRNSSSDGPTGMKRVAEERGGR